LHLTFHIQVVIKDMVTMFFETQCSFLGAHGAAAFSEHTEQVFWSMWSSYFPGAHGAEHTEYCFFISKCLYDNSIYVAII